MAVIHVAGASYAHPGGDVLFADVSFRVASGRHAAFVGVNGVGKSTLLRCITGELRPADGSISVDGVVSFMPQAIGTEDDATTTVQELLARYSPTALRSAAERLAAAEHANDDAPSERTGMALADAVIAWGEVGGYDHESRWDSCCSQVLHQPLARAGRRPVSELSGGERKRLVLESLFAADADILLLDEPDNFLDIPGKRWLERRIVESPKTILFISHDRELLAAAADAVVTLEGLGAWVHPGSWTTYDDARRARNLALGGALTRWKDEERRLFRHYKTMKQRASLNDGNAKAADAAEHRWERFVKIGPPPPPPPERHVRMQLAGGDSGRVALRLERLELSGLTDPFDLEVRFGDRVAVLGPNGSGKSHLLRLVAGEPVDHEGAWRLGARVTTGLFHQTDDVPEFRGRTPLAILHDRDLVEEAAMKALARYGLGDCARREVETMSGGQRARLQVLTLELAGVNPALDRPQPRPLREAPSRPGHLCRHRRRRHPRPLVHAGSTGGCCSATTAPCARPSTSTPPCTRSPATPPTPGRPPVWCRWSPPDAASPVVPTRAW
ncbi:MAG: ATP-binding cassette domain-containing protein [Acidimicrobiales bacterium]